MATGTTISYNGWTSDPGRIWFQITRTPITGRTGRVNKVIDTWSVAGSVFGTTPSQVDAKKVAFENAMLPGGDLVFSMGSYSMLSSNYINGTQVKRYSFLSGVDPVRGSGAQCVNRRDWTFTVQGEVIAASDTDIIAYHESITGWGGGPRIPPAESLTGDAQPQQTAARSAYHALQSGYAIGLTTQPPASTAIWATTPGVYYFPDQVRATLETPQNFGINISTGFVTRWSYQCWAAFALVTTPPVPF